VGNGLSVTPKSEVVMASESTCPFCRKPNRCEADEPTPCWCNEVDVPQELLDLLPAYAKGKVCICRACIEAYHSDPTGFAEQRKRG
jgi:hypothetical protein